MELTAIINNFIALKVYNGTGIIIKYLLRAPKGY